MLLQRSQQTIYTGERWISFYQSQIIPESFQVRTNYCVQLNPSNDAEAWTDRLKKVGYKINNAIINKYHRSSRPM